MTTQYERLTDSQWDAISPIFTIRKRVISLRAVVDALFYITRVGCQWRNLPKDFPVWSAVYYYFDKWKVDGTFEKVNTLLNELDRKNEEREGSPSLGCVDSQSVKLSPMMEKDRGIDGNKKVNGRKRQYLVDTGGRVWGVIVHAANIADGKGAVDFAEKAKTTIPRLKNFLGDTSYNGIFAESIREEGLEYEKITKINQAEKSTEFVVEPKRWVVERTIAWSNFFRRITKDYERTVESSVAWCLLANSTIMIQRFQKYNKI